MRQCDVIVIGAGVMGAAAGWEVARRGRDVVVLERFEQGHVRGSSHGGSRIFRLAYPEPAWVRLCVEALDAWRDLEDDAGVPLLDITGGVDHGAPFTIGRTAEALTAAGATHELMAPEAAAERWPAMRFEGSVLYQPDGGRCRADDTVLNLHLSIGNHGGEVRFEEPAAWIGEEDDGVTVETDFDRYWAPAVIVTVGSWAPSVVEAIEGFHPHLPHLSVTQEQTFHFLPRDDEAAWPSFIHHRLPAPIYGLATPGEGVKVAEHHAGPVVDPDERDFEIDPAGEARVVAYVEQWLPGLENFAVTAATCLYTTTPDEDFVVERRGPVVVGAGFSGHGFKFAPLIGKRLADLALQGQP